MCDGNLYCVVYNIHSIWNLMALTYGMKKYVSTLKLIYINRILDINQMKFERFVVNCNVEHAERVHTRLQLTAISLRILVTSLLYFSCKK